MDLFDVQARIVDLHQIAIIVANGKSGASDAERDKVGRELDAKSDFYHRRINTILALVFKIAPSSEALSLAEESKSLADDLSKKYGDDAPPQTPPATKEQIEKANEQFEGMLSRIEALPKAKVQPKVPWPELT